MPTRLTSPTKATEEQKLAASLRLFQDLVASKQYPRDFLIKYLCSLLGGYLFTTTLNLFGCINTKLIDYQRAADLPPNELDALARHMTDSLPSNVFLKIFGDPRSAFQLDTPDPKCLPPVLKFYQAERVPPYLVRSVADPELKQALEAVSELSKKLALTPTDSQTLRTYYRFVCNRFWTIKFMKTMKEKVVDVENLRKIIMETIIKAIIYAFSGNIPQTIFGQTNLTVNVGKKQIVLASTTDIEKHRDISQLHTALAELEKKSIPWRLYLDRALALILPLLLFTIFFTGYSVENPVLPWLFSALMPIAITLLHATIRQLHYLAFVRSRIELSIHKVEGWLKNALLLTSDTHDNAFTLEKIQIVGEWEKVQFALHPNQDSQKIIINTEKILVVQGLLLEYEIPYIIVKNRGEKIPSLYLNASDVYNTFANTLGFEGGSVSKFATQLSARLQKFILKNQIDLKLSELKTYSAIHAFWYHGEYPDKLYYKVNTGNNIQLQNYFVANGYARTHIGFDIFITANEPDVNQFLTVLDGYRPNAALEQPATPTSYLHEAATTVIGLFRRRATTPIVPVPTVVPLVPRQIIHRWHINNHDYSSTQNTVYMIEGTDTYQNPIYVTLNLTQEQFNSPYTFQRVRDVVAIARFARPRDQTGLFIRNNQQLLEVKVLGQNGQGNVRCYAQGFTVANNNGPHLYIISHIEHHAHRN